MGVESASDLSIFFDIGDFADSAKYTPYGKRTKTIDGIFDNATAQLSATDEMAITIPQPRFYCRSVDVTGGAEGDKIVIRNTDYTVRVMVDDGTGVSTLFLEKD